MFVVMSDVFMVVQSWCLDEGVEAETLQHVMPFSFLVTFSTLLQTRIQDWL